MTTLQLQVRKDRLDTTRLVEAPDTPLAEGQVRVRVDLAAYTANNITYAAFGDAMSYWQFYPVPPDADGSAWGCIPVWGFGQVVQSLHPGVAVGERLYGYWPTGSHAVLQPVRLTATGFADGAPHRAQLHGVYNQLLRCSADPWYTPGSEAVQALLRPLFSTAWLIDDFLADNAFFGTCSGGVRGVMLLSSASSKTAWATAAQLAQRPDVEVVGLTSAANVDFCRSLGVYGRVLAYEQLDQLAADSPCVYVDFAGGAALRRAVHGRFTRLAYSAAIGGTQVTDLGGGGGGLPGPKPVLFFAPAQVKKRSAEWGPEAFGQRLLQAWQALRERATTATPPWIQVQRHDGPAALQALHGQVLAGRGDPRLGHVFSLTG